MLRSFHITGDVTVKESAAPETVVIAVAGASAVLTKLQFRELCGLTYTINWVDPPMPPEDDVND